MESSQSRNEAPQSSITACHHPQSLPYDFFDSPESHIPSSSNQGVTFVREAFHQPNLLETPLPTQSTGQLPQQIFYSNITENPFASPEAPLPRTASLISLHSIDFEPGRSYDRTSTNVPLRPVTDFTLGEYFLHEMPDLPIFLDRFLQIFRDTWAAVRRIVLEISNTEWRKVHALAWQFLKGGAVTGAGLLLHAVDEGLSALRRVRWDDVMAFTREKVADVMQACAERIEDWRCSMFGFGAYERI